MIITSSFFICKTVWYGGFSKRRGSRSRLKRIMVQVRMSKLSRILRYHSTFSTFCHSPCVWSWLGHNSIRVDYKDISRQLPWFWSRNSDSNKMDSSFISNFKFKCANNLEFFEYIYGEWLFVYHVLDTIALLVSWNQWGCLTICQTIFVVFLVCSGCVFRSLGCVFRRGENALDMFLILEQVFNYVFNVGTSF